MIFPLLRVYDTGRFVMIRYSTSQDVPVVMSSLFFCEESSSFSMVYIDKSVKPLSAIPFPPFDDCGVCQKK